MRKPFQPRRFRRGAVTVEFTLGCSMIFVFFFARLEIALVNMIRHTIEAASYEAARQGILPGLPKQSASWLPKTTWM